MQKLLNFSVDPWDLDKFDNDEGRIRQFLDKHGVAGFEMIQYANWDDCVVPKELIFGAHTCFWPNWLDFWREDQASLLRQFGDRETCLEYYGFACRDDMVAYYRTELRKAVTAGVRYVLFHVSHIEMEHTYTYNFGYDDAEVTEAFVEMMNEILEGADEDLEIVFENHWYPGLTFLDRSATERLMSGIRHPKKGFALDIGHLMNTNLELATEKEAVNYMMVVLVDLGELASLIKVIHLNSSLTGEYVKKAIAGQVAYDRTLDFNERNIKLYEHISRIDTHEPFRDESIRRLIDYVDPAYLVYEFSVETLNKLDGYVELQNKVLNLVPEREASRLEML